MKSNIRNYLAALVLIGTGLPASAAAVYDTSLTNPPGVYFGSGNSNSHFTVDRTGDVEIGLSAIQRFLGPITPTGSTYHVNTGPTSVPGKTGSDWGFVFSVNLNYDNGASPYNLSNVTTRLTLNDVGLGTTGSFDPRLIGDNATYGNIGFQNAETLSFLGIRTALGDPLYDLNADDTYIFTLDVLSGATVIGSDRITVVAGRGAATDVPEPLTLSLLASGLAGIGILRRRKKTVQA